MKKKLFITLLLILAACCVAALALAEDLVMADTDQVYFQVKDISTLGEDILQMEVYLENRSDVPEMFNLEYCVINGYVVDTFWAKELQPGETADDTMLVFNLTENGVTGEIATIDFSIRVYNNEDWAAADILNEVYALYVPGMEDAKPADRELKDTDIVVVDNDDLSIVVTGFGEDEIWGFTVYYYLVNKTDKMLVYMANDVSVNGIPIDPFWSTVVPPYARSYEGMFWISTQFEEQEIDKVEEIEVTFRVYDGKEWTEDDIYNGKTVLNP